MERRWTARLGISLDVDLRFQEHELLDCKARDISFGGVFLEMSQFKPPVDSHVEMVFKVTERGELTQQTLPGKVVRVMKDGVGVMFYDFDADAFRSLRSIHQHKENPNNILSFVMGA